MKKKSLIFILLSYFLTIGLTAQKDPTHITVLSDNGPLYPVSKLYQLPIRGNGCVTIDTSRGWYLWNNNDEANNSILRIKDVNFKDVFMGRIEGEAVMHPNDSEMYNGNLYICDTGMAGGTTVPNVRVVDVSLEIPKLIETIQMPYQETYRTAALSINANGKAYLCQVEAVPVAQRTHIQVVEFDLTMDRTAPEYTPESAVISSFKIPTNKFYIQGSTLVGSFFFVTANNGGGQPSDILKVDLKTKSIVETITIHGGDETEGMLHYFKDGKLIFEFQEVNGSLYRMVY